MSQERQAHSVPLLLKKFAPWCDSVLRSCSLEQRSFISVRLLSHLSACRHLMEDSMDMDMSPLRPQNYLFGNCRRELERGRAGPGGGEGGGEGRESGCSRVWWRPPDRLEA